MAVGEKRVRMVGEMRSWVKDSTNGGLYLLADAAIAVYYEEKKMLRVIGQGAASGRSENHVCVGKMPSNAVEVTTPFVPPRCKRKRTALCSPMRGEALTRSLSPCHEVSGSSTGSEEEPLSPQPSSAVSRVEKAKKKERVKRQRPIEKPMRDGPKPFEPEDMPQDMRSYIEAELGGADIFPVSQKTLEATDVNPHHKRVFLPKADIRFLNEEEKAILERPNVKDRPIRVQVVDPLQLLDPRRKPHWLTFTRWELKKSDSGKASNVYLLSTAGWARLVEDNKLAARDEIQIWSFRVGPQLHMAVVVAKRAPPPQPEA